MSSKESKSLISRGSSVADTINVTRIVKYACITGVLIVAIVFSTRCISNILKTNNKN